MIDFNNIFQLTRRFLKAEKAYYSSVIILSIFLSLISLAIPISVQSLVNTVTFGVLLQPIIVLSLLLLFILIINVILNGLLYKSLEFFQQHFFAKTSLSIVENLINASQKKLHKVNKKILSHRYFDIMTVQKSMTLILADGTFIFLQLLVGMILISLYHPYFLIFDLILIISLIILWRTISPQAIKSAIKESSSKYDMARWIDQVAHQSFMFTRHPDLAYETSLIYANNYIIARKKHFRNLFAQIIGLFILYAILSAFVLGVGGFLVIIGELSIGQLIAAEIIVTIILTSLTKLGKILEKIYDLIAALNKLDLFYNLHDNQSSIISSDRIEFKNILVQDTANDLHYFNFQIDENKSYQIISKSDSNLNAFIKLLSSEYDIHKGQLHVKCKSEGQNSPKELVMNNFYILEKPEVITESIKTNIVLSSYIAQNELTRLINEIGLENSISNLPKGLATTLTSDGYPLSFKDLLMIEVLRALINKPLFIVLTHVFKVFSKDDQIKIYNLIKKNQIGIIVIFDIDFLIDTNDFIPLNLDYGNKNERV